MPSCKEPVAEVVERALLDRSSFFGRLQQESERAKRYGRPMAVFVVVPPDSTRDLGSKVLATVRSVDVVGALGDGAVGVICPETGEPVEVAAKRALAKLSGAERAGCAVLSFDGLDGEALLSAAHGAALAAAAGTVRSAGEDDVVRVGSTSFVLRDAAMRRLLELARQLATSDLPIVVTGETGSGKEMFSTLVHAASSRASGPLVSVNCAALTDSLLESELFGHDRGAFTGATHERAGLIESAHGGTLFLDEVGDAPARLQAELLRVLETGKVRRVGASRERTADVRIVAATNRDLARDAAAGRFRRDLYFRLRGAQLVVPPLRERKADIPALVRAFLRRSSERRSGELLSISTGAMEKLIAHDWPGNVREVRNVIDYVAAVARDGVVRTGDLPPSPSAQMSASAEGPEQTFRPIAQEIAELERRRMREALTAASGVRSRAAALISMPLRTFATKLKLYALDSSGDDNLPRGDDDAPRA